MSLQRKRKRVSKYCPLCEITSENFKPYGVNPRENAMCPHCGSLERHRLAWLYIKEQTFFLEDSSKKMLHVAPEKILMQLFQRQLQNGYLSADLHDKRAMVSMDIENIQYEDESFDYIYCSHVLEHVYDDKRAMREFHRVLKKYGWAILLVPVMNIKKTFEDFSITDPKERAKVFGQEDHVRNYGEDYIDRLRESGWSVEVICPKDFLNQAQIINMGITKAAGEIYFCTKKAK